MSDDFSDSGRIEPDTMRGRDWPCLRQFCVFLENRVGRLYDLLKLIETHDLRAVAVSVVDTVDFCVVRLIVDGTDRARELFSLSDFTVIENDVVGVELPEGSQPFVQVCLPLLAAEMNVHYTYPMLYRRGGHGAVVLHVDDIDAATQILRNNGHTILTEGDLENDDEFF